MPVAAFANLGCKVNQYETDKMIGSFVALGFDIGEFDQPADVYVINTCSVTNMADRKSRLMARRAARLKEGAKVVMTGCFAQLALDTDEHVEGASLLVPNRDKMRVAEYTVTSFPDLIGYSGSPLMPSTAAAYESKPGQIAVFPEQAGFVPLRAITRPGRLAHTRATLKVQDGCQHFCAFCSIPYTRNTMASRALDAVVAEARQMAAGGVREVVVTGVCVGAYHDEDSGAKLPDLMAAIARVEGIERVRLSSLQPIETDPALIDVLAAHETICPHLHLSLQSGDDTVLTLMQRPYNTGYYRNLVTRLRKRIPGIAITTDIIVGFPGETIELFENTLRFAEEIGFSRAHIFRYSPRERTFAHREFNDDVPNQEKERRHRELSEVCRRTQVEFASRLIGECVEVIVEGRGRSGGYMSGYTDNYVKAHFPADRSMARQLVTLRIDGVTEDGDAFGMVTDAAARGE